MKKHVHIALLSIFFLVIPGVSYISAEGISVGASVWYCWWKFNDSETMKVDPAFLFGPALSFRLSESWSLAGVFLYGRFKTDDDGNDGGSTDINRFDSDISLNYNINRYFKIFGGVKLMGFFWDVNGDTGTHMSAGPGLGIGTTLPLTEYLYFLFNVSATGSYGKHYEPARESDDSSTTVNMTETGANTNISLAYYIASASTSISLGFRYQYLYINYLGNKDKFRNEGMSFYGITLSAIFSF